MSISSFNKGLDDAYMGNCPRTGHQNNIDYLEGYQTGEDIEAKRDYEVAIKKEYEEEMKKQQEEYYKTIKG